MWLKLSVVGLWAVPPQTAAAGGREGTAVALGKLNRAVSNGEIWEEAYEVAFI